MNNKHLRRIITFGSVVLAGLFVVQMYWFKKAFDVEERQFDHSIQIALLKVAARNPQAVAEALHSPPRRGAA